MIFAKLYSKHSPGGKVLLNIEVEIFGLEHFCHHLFEIVLVFRGAPLGNAFLWNLCGHRGENDTYRPGCKCNEQEASSDSY